jgi:hypothetical protein
MGTTIYLVFQTKPQLNNNFVAHLVATPFLVQTNFTNLTSHTPSVG